ncbi:methyl methanesulfonate sensitivity 4 isoform X2 [Dermacentor variabilis]|uniref:methyl methanesulfonate sensitivity 4 isoform X2 n=1 Tax=Dermacentor variabilis TaxID=34621 RepID=UPI003F5B27BC
MAAACIILDSDGDDEVNCGSCEAPTTPARDISRTGGAVPFVDLCSDVEEKDCGDQLIDAAPSKAQQRSASEERSSKGTVTMTSTPAEAVPQTSVNSGRSSTSECEAHRGSLWDSDDEELAPLSARLQPQQPSSSPQDIKTRSQDMKTSPQDVKMSLQNMKTSPLKRTMVHRISDSEDEDGLPDLGHVISACVESGVTARPLSLNGQRVPAAAAPGTVTHVDEENVVAPAYTQLKAKRVRITPEEREARRAAKELEKQRKAMATEMGRATKPGHCMKYVTVVLDSRLLDDEASLQLLRETLDQAEIRAEIQTLPVERAVCWRRTALSLNEDDCLLSREQMEERDVMVVLPWDQFLHLVASQRQAGAIPAICCTLEGTHVLNSSDSSARTQTSLSEHMMSISEVYPNRQLTYVVYGLEKYFKQQKSRANAEYRALVLGSQQAVRRRKPGVYDGVPLSRKDVQETLVPLQLDSGVTVATKESTEELAEYLAKFTRALAERPHREAKQSRPLQHLAPGSLSKHDSLRRTWQAQLEQFASVSRDVAEAIVCRYPGPKLLLQAYQACKNRAEGETLLADIQVRRGAGALQSTRRVGPIVSGRIYRFFLATDQHAYFD